MKASTSTLANVSSYLDTQSSRSPQRQRSKTLSINLLLTSKLLPSTKERALRRWKECQKQLRPLSLLQEEIQTLMNRSLRLLLSRFKHSRLFLSPNKRQLLNLLPSLNPPLSLFLSKKTKRPLHQKRRKVVAFGLGYWGFCCFACSHFWHISSWVSHL